MEKYPNKEQRRQNYIAVACVVFEQWFPDAKQDDTEEYLDHVLFVSFNQSKIPSLERMIIHSKMLRTYESFAQSMPSLNSDQLAARLNTATQEAIAAVLATRTKLLHDVSDELRLYQQSSLDEANRYKVEVNSIVLMMESANVFEQSRLRARLIEAEERVTKHRDEYLARARQYTDYINDVTGNY